MANDLTYNPLIIDTPSNEILYSGDILIYAIFWVPEAVDNGLS